MEKILKLFVIIILSAVVRVQSFWNYNDWLQLPVDDYNRAYELFYFEDDENYLKCGEILENFEKGRNYFVKEFNASEHLINDGFLQSLEEPFSPLFFGNDILFANRIKDFLPSLSALRGIQYILNAEMKKYYGKLRPNQAQIQKFLKKISDCIPKEERCSVDREIICDPNARYRSLDGTCNNLANPLKGATFTPYGRLTEAFYDDNVMEIRKNWKGTELTSPRRLVDKVLSLPMITNLNEEYIPNMGFNMFGQALAHDVASLNVIHHNIFNGIQNGTRCCSSDYKKILPKSQSHYSCLPFKIAPDDKFYGSKNFGCHNFVRTQPTFPTDCSLSSAQQVNMATGYIDLSIIYGQNTPFDQRAYVLGLLKTNKNNVLDVIKNCDRTDCYISGDLRVNQTPSLALIHSLFVRLHNLIARTLKNINPTWGDETLFQEARRINIAIFQNIVYEEYVPMLLGEHLTCTGYSCNYNPNEDATTTNDFATSIFRYLHIFCTKNFEFYDEYGRITKLFKLSDILDDTRILETNYDDVARGLIYQKINLAGFDDEMINRVLKGTDLISLDIQRGRDHGLAPYWKYRELCSFGTIETFEDLSPFISQKNIELLKIVYSSPKDIDVYVGGALEEKIGSSLLGPTFKCIAKTQFLRSKNGDRFFYTHSNSPYPFTAYQLDEIKKFSFSKLLCAVTDIKKVPLNGLFKPSLQNYLVSCDSLKPLDLTAWRRNL